MKSNTALGGSIRKRAATPAVRNEAGGVERDTTTVHQEVAMTIEAGGSARRGDLTYRRCPRADATTQFVLPYNRALQLNLEAKDVR
jgi:hypothetical protein